jgi:hypothetical protein
MIYRLLRKVHCDLESICAVLLSAAAAVRDSVLLCKGLACYDATPLRPEYEKQGIELTTATESSSWGELLSTTVSLVN